MELRRGHIISINKKEWQHSKSKPYRPALVVIEGKGEYTIAAPITHVKKRNKYCIEIHSPDDLVEGSLKYKVSYIKVNDTQPISNKSIRKIIGRINQEKIKEVLTILDEILEKKLIK
ncbi:hypothetical protein LCGC14_3033950 [marine sediment metagenome]|uniref:MazF family transcriptional regulator n=1 Tax=marine sediment metagenome TaxID=412755 RepID=A0A0F8WRD0_9ZZZZ